MNPIDMLGVRLADLARAIAAKQDRPRKATVTAVDSTAGARNITVAVRPEGAIPKVYLLTHHLMPNVDDSVWIRRVGGDQYIFEGKQG